MRTHSVVISVAELQQALLDYAFKHAKSQPHEVLVDNGYGKIVFTVPLKLGTVVRGEEFQRQTEAT